MKKIFNFFAMIKNDLRTMHWAPITEVQKSYFLVLALAFILGMYIFGLDSLFTKVYQLVIF
jgi:preprotein translocase SecE subunit